MEISKEEILHIASLASLKIKDEEIEEYRKNLAEILNFANTINSIDTSKIEGTSGISSNVNVFREDVVKEFDNKDGLMQDIHWAEGAFGYFPSYLLGSIYDGMFLEAIEEKLGNICNITTGKLDANAMVENGQYRFYTCAKDYYYIDKYAFDTEALLISGNGAYVGYIHYYKGKFNAYQRTYVLDQFTENIQYIKYLSIT